MTFIVQAYEGQPLRIRVRLDADMPDTEYHHLLLFDGDPNAGGTLIADKQAYASGDPDGSYLWVDWPATGRGQHRLYARVLANDANGKPVVVTSDMLKVEVILAPRGPKPKSK